METGPEICNAKDNNVLEFSVLTYQSENINNLVKQVGQTLVGYVSTRKGLGHWKFVSGSRSLDLKYMDPLS